MKLLQFALLISLVSLASMVSAVECADLFNMVSTGSIFLPGDVYDGTSTMEAMRIFSVRQVSRPFTFENGVTQNAFFISLTDVSRVTSGAIIYRHDNETQYIAVYYNIQPENTAVIYTCPDGTKDQLYLKRASIGPAYYSNGTKIPLDQISVISFRTENSVITAPDSPASKELFVLFQPLAGVRVGTVFYKLGSVYFASEYSQIKYNPPLLSFCRSFEGKCYDATGVNQSSCQANKLTDYTCENSQCQVAKTTCKYGCTTAACLPKPTPTLNPTPTPTGPAATPSTAPTIAQTNNNKGNDSIYWLITAVCIIAIIGLYILKQKPSNPPGEPAKLGHETIRPPSRPQPSQRTPPKQQPPQHKTFDLPPYKPKNLPRMKY